MVRSTSYSTAGTFTVLGGSGSLAHMQLTKAGSADVLVTVYDNPAAGSGRIVWQGGGTTSGDFDCTDGAGTGSVCTTGATLVIAGTTPPIVVVTVE